MTISTFPATGLARSPSEPDDATDRGIYGGRVFDGVVHSCSACGRNAAFAHSVRIRQDDPGRPLCFDCRSGSTIASCAPPAAEARPAAALNAQIVREAAPRQTSPDRTAGGSTARRFVWRRPIPSFSGKAAPVKRALPPLGDLVFRRDPARGVDVTAWWCGDPPVQRSAMARAQQAHWRSAASPGP